MEKFVNEIPRGQMSTIILSALLSGDKYGYEIIEEVTKMTNGRIVIKQPTLYSTLKKLETQKLITSYMKDSNIGGKRRYSRLTDYGKKQVEKWKEDLLKTNQDILILDQKTETDEKTDDGKFLTQDDVHNNTLPSSIISEDEKISEIKNDTEQKDESKSDTFLQYNLFEIKNEPISTPNVDMVKPNVQVKVIPQHDEITDKIAKYGNSVQEQDKENVNNSPSFDIFEEINTLRTNKKSFSDMNKSIVEEKKVSFSKMKDETNENVEATQRIKINSILANTTKSTNLSDEILANQKENNNKSNKVIDDAVFITEKIDPESVPHVKKIETSKLDLLDVENSALKNKILEKARQKKAEREKENLNYKDKVNLLYQKKSQKTEEEPIEVDNVVQEPIKQPYFSDYETLKKYYDTNSIYFDLYKKRKDCQINKTNYVYINKLNFVSSFVLFFVSIIISLSLYFPLSTITRYGLWVYIVFPCIFLINLIFRLVIYMKNKNKKQKLEINISTYMIKMFIFILISLLIFAINLLIGMTFSNILYFLNTIVFPITSTLLIIVSDVITTLLGKIKVFRV